MLERLFEFVPSLITLLGLAALGVLYSKVILPMIFGKENYKNEEWFKNWAKNHKIKAFFFISTPIVVITGPALEELVFRGPLVIIFNQVLGYAWPAMIFSSTVFALMHCLGKTSEKLFEGIKLFLKEKGVDTESDAEINETREKRTIKRMRIGRATASFILGMLTGYLGIKYQSLWLCFYIHAAWNLLMPVILTIMFILIMLAGATLWLLVDKIGWWWRWEARRWLRRRGIHKNY